MQRVYDSGHESVKRQRAIKYRLKMMHEAAEEIERLQARVDELEGVLDRVDYALENIWAIDRDRLRQLIADGVTEQVGALEGEVK